MDYHILRDFVIYRAMNGGDVAAAVALHIRS